MTLVRAILTTGGNATVIGIDEPELVEIDDVSPATSRAWEASRTYGPFTLHVAEHSPADAPDPAPLQPGNWREAWVSFGDLGQEAPAPWRGLLDLAFAFDGQAVSTVGARELWFVDGTCSWVARQGEPSMAEITMPGTIPWDQLGWAKSMTPDIYPRIDQQGSPLAVPGMHVETVCLIDTAAPATLKARARQILEHNLDVSMLWRRLHYTRDGAPTPHLADDYGFLEVTEGRWLGPQPNDETWHMHDAEGNRLGERQQIPNEAAHCFRALHRIWHWYWTGSRAARFDADCQLHNLAGMDLCRSPSAGHYNMPRSAGWAGRALLDDSALTGRWKPQIDVLLQRIDDESGTAKQLDGTPDVPYIWINHAQRSQSGHSYLGCSGFQTSQGVHFVARAAMHGHAAARQMLNHIAEAWRVFCYGEGLFYYDLDPHGVRGQTGVLDYVGGTYNSVHIWCAAATAVLIEALPQSHFLRPFFVEHLRKFWERSDELRPLKATFHASEALQLARLFGFRS